MISLALDHLDVLICRLTIQVIHLYESPGKVDTEGRIRLYTTARQLIGLVETLDKTVEPAAYSTAYIYPAVVLAAVVLLRLLKHSVAKGRDQDDLKPTFFSALNLLKRMSIENNDGAAKSAIMLSQLWTSDRVFRNRDGTTNFELRIRTRLAMSLVYDCTWWWREEFGGQQNPYRRQEEYGKGIMHTMLT